MSAEPASDQRRAAMLDAMADFVLAEGLEAASLRPLAKAADTSDRMLLYYFKDKTEILSAVLEQIAARMTAMLAAARTGGPAPLSVLQADVTTLMQADAVWPYMRVWLDMASRAAGGDALCRKVGGEIGRGFHAWAMAQLDSADPAADAARLLVQVEGAVLLRSLGLDDIAALGVNAEK